MDVIFYSKEDGDAPVKTFLMDNYAMQSGIKGNKFRGRIIATINHVASNNGLPSGDFSTSLYKYIFIFEIKIRGDPDKMLLRITYAIDENKLVLLNAFRKKALYENNQKKKTNKFIDKKYQEANLHYEEFLKRKKYEKSEQFFKKFSERQ